VLAYLIARFGDVLAFPFYRSRVLSKVPREKASSIPSVLASYRKLIALASSSIASTAGFLASIRPILPYLASLILFLTSSSIILITYKSRLNEI